MNLLALDYGTRRIGVAIATTPLAEPLLIVQNKLANDQEIITDTALQTILDLINRHQIEKIVVGVSEGKTAEKTLQFCELLSKKTEIVIEQVDETLSSFHADELSQFQKKSKREADKDHIAAAKFLQDYLDLLPQAI